MRDSPFQTLNWFTQSIDMSFFRWAYSLVIGNTTSLLSGRFSNGYILTNSSHHQFGLVSLFS